MKDLVLNVKEVLKHDFNEYKHGFVLLLTIVVYFLKFLRKDKAAFHIVSSIYRFGWKGSEALAAKEINYYFVKNKALGKKIALQEIMSVKPETKTKRFFDHPDHMVGRIITVLSEPSGNKRGVLIINYSIYFSLFVQLFDIVSISKRYYIILEPSWAGVCELPILYYSSLETPILLQTYESRDFELIKNAKLNLTPIKIGPSWFINHDVFIPQNENKIYDLVMVAAWAEFKCHKEFFKVVKTCCDNDKNFKIALVGYSVDMTLDQIKNEARKAGVYSHITFYERVSREKVSTILSQSKINVLWSKFEGNNRAIIEGMFCNVPVILREGHNYGEKYDFINDLTGSFANETNFQDIVKKLLENYDGLNPRKYVLENRSCIMATRKIEETITQLENSSEETWHDSLAVKTNELSGMNYLNLPLETFIESQTELKSFIYK